MKPARNSRRNPVARVVTQLRPKVVPSKRRYRRDKRRLTPGD